MSLINKAEVKRRLLEVAENTRSKQFTRVSKGTLLGIERKLDDIIRHYVASMPSKGKTL